MLALVICPHLGSVPDRHLPDRCSTARVPLHARRSKPRLKLKQNLRGFKGDQAEARWREPSNARACALVIYWRSEENRMAKHPTQLQGTASAGNEYTLDELESDIGHCHDLRHGGEHASRQLYDRRENWAGASGDLGLDGERFPRPNEQENRGRRRSSSNLGRAN